MATEICRMCDGNEVIKIRNSSGVLIGVQICPGCEGTGRMVKTDGD